MTQQELEQKQGGLEEELLPYIPDANVRIAEDSDGNPSLVNIVWNAMAGLYYRTEKDPFFGRSTVGHYKDEKSFLVQGRDYDAFVEQDIIPFFEGLNKK